MVEEHGIHHGCLIHHQKAAGQRPVLVAGKAGFLRAEFQQPVYRAGLMAAGFGHALGSPPRRGRQENLGPCRGKESYDCIDNGGLASAWSAGQHHDLLASGHQHGLTLGRGKAYAKPPGRPVASLLKMRETDNLWGAHDPRKIKSRLALIVMHSGKIKGRLPLAV